ncbi:MAG: transglutaminase protein [Firmicutes bacterium]|nr:transglutaminase protein [Bacillota bacterium]
MFQDRDKLYQAYRTLLSMALGWALVLVINKYFELKVTVFLCAFFSFMTALCIYLIDLNKKNTVTYLVIGGSIPILALLFWVRHFNPVLWAEEYGNWFVSYDGTKELYQARFSNFTIFIIGFVGIILFFLLTRTQLLKILLAIAVTVGLVILSVNKINIGKFVIGICIFYIISILVECYGIIYTRKAGKQEKKESILYLAPICLLLAILAVSMPSKEEPIQWKAVRHMYENIQEQIEEWKTELGYYFDNHGEEFFISLTGYSEDSGNLRNESSNLVKDEKVAMKFTGSTRNRAVYLIGSVSDIYTGDSWEKSRDDFLAEEQEYKLDYMELSYALARQELDDLENNSYVEHVTLKLQYNYIKTKTFFYPLKTSWFNLLSDERFPSAGPSNIIFDEPKGRGTSYEDIFYEMNLQGDAFIQMLRDADSFSYEEAPSIKLDSYRWLEDNVLIHDNVNGFAQRWDYYELLGDRAKLIKDKYSALPEELPARVKKLAEKITAGYDTDYDKLKAIEAYLQKYRYSFTPANPPEGQDYVDYFLFESKSGYCTSFATAMAVLGRCIGIPMRYVEGFVAKYEFQDKEDNMYPIKNSQAHAWAEAYIEGVGWIPFEATANFSGVRYTTWVDPSKASEQLGEAYPGHYEGNIQGGYVPFNGVPVDQELETKDTMNEIIAGIIVTIGTILIMLMLFLTYYNVLRYRYRKAYDRADTNQRLYLMFLKVLDLLKKEGYHLEEQETILMLAHRVKDRFHYERIIFPDVANIFMRYRYAQETITEEELKRVVIYKEGLSLKRREEQPGFKLWLEEFVFLMRMRNV